MPTIVMMGPREFKLLSREPEGKLVEGTMDDYNRELAAGNITEFRRPGSAPPRQAAPSRSASYSGNSAPQQNLSITSAPQRVVRQTQSPTFVPTSNVTTSYTGRMDPEIRARASGAVPASSMTQTASPTYVPTTNAPSPPAYDSWRSGSSYGTFEPASYQAPTIQPGTYAQNGVPMTTIIPMEQPSNEPTIIPVNSPPYQEPTPTSASDYSIYGTAPVQGRSAPPAPNALRDYGTMPNQYYGSPDVITPNSFVPVSPTQPTVPAPNPMLPEYLNPYWNQWR